MKKQQNVAVTFVAFWACY